MIIYSIFRAYFDYDRNSIKWPTLVTSLAPLVKAIGFFDEELPRSYLDHGMQIVIMFLDLGKVSLYKASTCSLAIPEQCLKRLDVARKNIDADSLSHSGWKLWSHGVGR